MGILSLMRRDSIAPSVRIKSRLIFPGVHLIPPVLDRDDVLRVLESAKSVVHHDEDDGHHVGKEKPTHLPWVAEKIWPYVAGLRNGSYAVDPMMRLYRLEAGAGKVVQHMDRDFNGPDGTYARDSIILYLNDSYTGGETVFRGTQVAPHGEAGGGLFFRHDIPHKGRKVETGTKYVLKTDLFTIPC